MTVSTPVQLASLIVIFAAGFAACGSTTDKWTGSVDAVFRYRPSDRSTVVHEIRPGTWSEASGLQPGDRVLAVDGVDVTELPYGEIRAAMRGPVGTVALLAVQREGELLEIQVERRPITTAPAEE
ncbi:MAG: PDZ domain-containing protein [Deltaproteobacteria bacterium]|nr:PDZ domain-containing protein [Deltaproteobacteria bacterium]